MPHFAPRYFAPRYFAPRYYGTLTSAAGALSGAYPPVKKLKKEGEFIYISEGGVLTLFGTGISVKIHDRRLLKKIVYDYLLAA